MDTATRDNLVKMMMSENDSDAIMGLRGLQGLLRVEGIDMARAIMYIVDNKSLIRDQTPAAGGAVNIAPAAEAPKRQAIQVSGSPQCHAPQKGMLEIVPPGKSAGEAIALPGAAAAECELIALHLKDALVAAAINKSTMKLKLVDVKNAKGEIIETTLRAEYERDGMVPIPIWTNVRGEVAALATVLRRAVAGSVPELIAA